jgi:fucose 4-O-acetylase-like acetyltransferase
VHFGFTILSIVAAGRGETCEEELLGLSASSVSLLQHSLDLKRHGVDRLDVNPGEDGKQNETVVDIYNRSQSQDIPPEKLAELFKMHKKQILNSVVKSLEVPLVPNVRRDTVVALGFDAFAIGVVVLIIHWWKSGRPAAESTGSTRSALLDNAKVLGSCLVIYNHCMYFAVEQSHSQKVDPVAPLSLLLNRDFSHVVNPTFVLVSGITSQGGPTIKRIRRYVQFLVIPTLMFHFIIFPYLIKGMIHLDLMYTKDKIQDAVKEFRWATKHLPDWYLTSLCLWRALTYALFSHIPKYVSLPLMIFLSCAAGYFALPDMLNPVFSYMPVFGLGYCFPLAKVEQAVPKPNNAVSACVVVMAFVYVSIIMPSLFPALPGTDPFTGVLPDSHGWYGDNDTTFLNALPWDYSLWWSRRLAKLFSDMVIPLALIFLVLPRHETALTYAGQHTLYSYLTQGILFSWRRRVMVSLPTDHMEGFLLQVFKELLYVPFTLVAFVVLTSSYWRLLFSWGFTPKWLDPILDRCEHAVSSLWGTEAQVKDKQTSEEASTSLPSKSGVASISEEVFEVHK